MYKQRGINSLFTSEESKIIRERTVSCDDARDKTSSSQKLLPSSQILNVDIVYVDKNNTADKWPSLSQDLRALADQERGLSKIHTVLLLPQQKVFDKGIYNTPNPICPEFIYECFFRIFNRKNHCLPGSDKPVIVEVIFKFMKLFDNIDFNLPSPLFDHSLCLPFVNYDEQHQIS